MITFVIKEDENFAVSTNGEPAPCQVEVHDYTYCPYELADSGEEEEILRTDKNGDNYCVLTIKKGDIF